MTSAGRVNQTPSELLTQLTNIVAATNPGYTNSLPGSLISDITGTDVAAATLMDQAVTELVNSVTPFGANEFLLNQLGAIYGVQRGATTNTSVSVVFSGSIGYMIMPGFTVSDGTHSYTVVDGGIIGISGSSDSLYCIATQTGTWPVPAGSVTSVTTSVQSAYSVTCINPQAGTPSTGAQTVDDYRAQVLTAGMCMTTGVANMLTAQLERVPGVQPRLIAMQQSAGAWKILVGGGDPYAVAYAIYKALGFNIALLTLTAAPTVLVTGITSSTTGVVTTSTPHRLLTGMAGVTITGVVGMTGINGVALTIAVIDALHFSVGNTTTYGTYTSGGTVNSLYPRNQSISIRDGGQGFLIKYVNPPQQAVVINLTWNAFATIGLISASSITQLGAPAIAGYINTIPLGQPINVFSLNDAFISSVTSILPANLIDRLVFTVYIDGILTTPTAGTGAITGDAEGYFYATPANVTIVQG
jgi:hypothetical protein